MLGIPPLLLVIAGALLMISEAFMPGIHFVPVGWAVLITGIVGLFVTSNLFVMLLVFIIVSVASLYVYRQFQFFEGGNGGQTSDSSSIEGKTATVTQEITPSKMGEVKVTGGGGFSPYYTARSEFEVIEEGTEVIITDGGGGNVLTVATV